MWLVLAERLVTTATATFSIGSIDAGTHDGFSPGGHFDVGIGFWKLRFAGELDAGLWANEDAPDDMPESGSFHRGGAALRFYFMDLDVGPRDEPGKSLLRLYTEAGLGKQTIDAPSYFISRNDVMLGFGMQQEAHFSKVTLGGTFGIRVLLSEAPAPGINCRGMCPTPMHRKHDIAMFFTMGLAFGP